MKEQIKDGYRVYRYRWVVLALYIGVALMIQLLWANFFSITTTAAAYFGYTDKAAGENAIGMFSIVFLLGMIIFAIPSMAAFERFGFKKTVGFGSVIMSIAALVRGVWGHSYAVTLGCTIAFAIAQPFIINGVNIVSSKWFPVKEHATANGLGLLSNYIGIILALLVTPLMLDAGISILDMMLIYGIVTAVLAILFVVLAREAPQTPPSEIGQTVRLEFAKGIREIFRKRNFVIACIAFLCMLGVFCMFFTLIDPIIQQVTHGRINSMEIGIVGVITLVGAIAGSLIIPILSDKDRYHRRKPYFIIANILGLLGFVMILLMKDYTGICIAALIYGFFSLGSSPVIMTYCAEIAYPTSEGTSAGILLCLGNLAGAVFLEFSAVLNGNMIYSMLMMSGILLSSCALLFTVTEKTPQMQIYCDTVPTEIL